MMPAATDALNEAPVDATVRAANALGHGLVEKPYENALAVEFGLQNVPFRQQPLFDASTKDTKSVSSFPT